MGFLRHITGNQVRSQVDQTWETPAAEEFIWVVGMKLVAKYIGRRQATVSQWVDLLPLLELCARETGYDGGGWNKSSWWRQQTTKETLWTILEEA